jgi:hypothetical protein
LCFGSASLCLYGDSAERAQKSQDKATKGENRKKDNENNKDGEEGCSKDKGKKSCKKSRTSAKVTTKQQTASIQTSFSNNSSEEEGVGIASEEGGDEGNKDKGKPNSTHLEEAVESSTGVVLEKLADVTTTLSSPQPLNIVKAEGPKSETKRSGVTEIAAVNNSNVDDAKYNDPGEDLEKIREKRLGINKKESISCLKSPSGAGTEILDVKKDEEALTTKGLAHKEIDPNNTVVDTFFAPKKTVEVKEVFKNRPVDEFGTFNQGIKEIE